MVWINVYSIISVLCCAVLWKTQSPINELQHKETKMEYVRKDFKGKGLSNNLLYH